MGLPPPPPPINQQDSYFAVEFDTHFDPSLGDINGNHIGIDVDSVVSVASVDAISKGINLKSGRKISVWVEYRDAVKIARVWVGHSSAKPSNPILIAQIDLSQKLKEFMHVGFSASNGKGSSIHIVHHWQFKTFGSHVDMDTDQEEEGDCFFCCDQLDQNSTSPAPYIDYDDESENETHYNRRRRKIEEAALGLGGISAILVSALVISIFLTKRSKKGTSTSTINNYQFQTPKLPSRLSLSEIKSATMGFNRDRLVGEGGSAKVYKGSLPHGGGDVAVKRFSRVNCNFPNPFTTEFATMVGCLRHKNLVQLQGWCCEGSELVLVYEYLPNGSLNKILHKNYNSSLILSWKQRVNIVLGVASALTYLHEECERQIIHRDVKTCNILLDSDFNPKLGDFGLAEVYEHSSNSNNTTRREATLPAGTMGYLAPEYVYSGVPTVKTDVYSFGVVVLEVATGRRPVEDDGTVIVDYVWRMWERRKLIDARDGRLMGKFDGVEMERMLMVGLACVHPDYESRPRVRDVGRILKGEAPLPWLPPSKPRVRIRPVLPSDNEETLDVVGIGIGIGSRPSTDDAQYLTPRSQFGSKRRWRSIVVDFEFTQRAVLMFPNDT
ncbi:L-type lectin-domain containing receptor kinase S.6 [Senna tora]|uniref:non-specific serine/threonine protein kinase n=1 Tax=Senna tora TaxID=362788 RepID=A0A834TEY3_9FABA|nr:L-type lectin-domain containing receptor kinase S.6 [Senna tora]